MEAALRSGLYYYIRGEVMKRQRARENPIGMPVGKGVTLVRVGKQGKQTHVYDPNLEVKNQDGTTVTVGAPICLSGFKATAPGGKRFNPELYRSDANFVTCYRCEKLSQMNLRRHGSVLPQ